MDTDQLLQAVLSLLFVLALLAGLAWLARRTGLTARVTASTPTGKTLRIVEILSVDMRHKVIRLQDGKTHYLIMTGGESPVLLATTPAPEATV